MTTKIDNQLSAKFMASALNFNSAIKKLFGNQYSLETEQAFSIQFSSIDKDTVRTLLIQQDLPKNIRAFLVEFENGMTQEEYNDPRFSYRVAIVQKAVNNKNTADQLLQIIPFGSEASNAMNKAILKETEKIKYLPKTIVSQMKAEGFVKFTMHKHTILWQEKDAKNPKHQYGTQVESQWYWYEPWLDQVRQYCNQNEPIYKIPSSVQPIYTSETKLG
jgi:hypothetical protein